MDTNKYQFPAMLGPSEDWEVGSKEWAIRASHGIQLAVEKAEDWGIDRLVNELIEAFPHKVWELFPDPPCRTVEDYFQLVTGHSWTTLVALIKEYHPDFDITDMDRTIRESNAVTVTQGVRNDLEPRTNDTKLTNQKDKMLRRFQRAANDNDLHAIELLRQIDAGVISTNAAAIQAGFRKKYYQVEATKEAVVAFCEKHGIEL